ncbi:MAG: hypothetical protein JW818_11575, partial [Pirellulales bacterium]|nr:hypothetical protein [Pirellulales bacterium]
MFPRSDRAKRYVGIVAFVGLCVLPTLGILAWSVGWRLPMHARSEARALSRLLGLDVSLDGVEHPRPGVNRYHGLDLVDPETDQVVLRCRKLQTSWRTATSSEGLTKQILFLSASGVDVEASRLKQLGQLVRRALAVQLGNADVDVHLVAEELVVQDKGKNVSLPFAQVKGMLCAFDSGARASLSLRPADPRAAEPVQIILGRDRQIQPPSEWFELRTGNTALPCSLVAEVIEPLRCAGSQATLRGRLGAKRAPGGWEGTVGPAEFNGVDLASLTADYLPGQLTGTARIEIIRAA